MSLVSKCFGSLANRAIRSDSWKGVVVFGNEPTGCLIVLIPLYAVGLWMAYRYVGGWAWYGWVLAVVLPVVLLFLLMLLVGVTEDLRDKRRKGGDGQKLP